MAYPLPGADIALLPPGAVARSEFSRTDAAKGRRPAIPTTDMTIRL